jgi:hypothetical protein
MSDLAVRPAGKLNGTGAVSERRTVEQRSKDSIARPT